MDWSEDVRADLRERHLQQIKLYLIFVTAIFVTTLPVYYFTRVAYNLEVPFFPGIRAHFGRIYDFLFPIPLLIIAYGFLVGVYYLLKRNLWIPLNSWFILLADVFNLTCMAYIFGSPHIYTMIGYPMVIMFYSIYIHPALATRFCILTMAILGGITWCILKDVIPFFPIMQIDPVYYAFFSDYVTNPANRSFTYSAYGVVAGLSFATLVVVNSIVKELRQREDELVASNRQISRLSDKLKVYLPHQFVESLAHGDRDTLPDYKRRKLTVFFSDVKGFTAWTDKLEPEETRELLNQYLSEMSKIANEWEGTIDKFIGDAILIFFGDPEFTNDRDHAVRCVKMALEMQVKMSALRAEWEDIGHQEPLHIRVGINTGYATVGNFGSEDRLNYTVLGSAVNLASRLESVCSPDKITVSHTTYSLIKNEFECKHMGEVTVKGFNEPVKIYEVQGIKEVREADGT